MLCYIWNMRDFRPIALIALAFALLCGAPSLCAQTPEAFRWVNFQSETDADIVSWVTHSIAKEKWTSIREIGVQYDAALVVTQQRSTTQSMPDDDIFTIWSASLTSHDRKPILTGTKLRFAGWLRFVNGHASEIAALYDDCTRCQATTYFTTFHYDPASHDFVTRWMKAGQAAPVWSSNTLAEGDWVQIYGVYPRPDGTVQLGTWSHFEDSAHKPQQDYVYLYSIEVSDVTEEAVPLTGKMADQMKQRLCHADGLVPGLARGQDAPICFRYHSYEPHPITSPPANNHGKALP
jgi:hypothetical protein